MLLTASLGASGKGPPGPLRSRPGSYVLHDCSLMTVPMQDNPRELSLPMENSVYGYCGVCADKYPNEDLHRIVEATGRRTEVVHELAFKDLVFFDFSGSLQDQLNAGDPTWKTKISKVGSLRQVVRNAPREKLEEMVEIMRKREPFSSEAVIQCLAKQELGLRRTDTTTVHLSKTIALRDSRGVFVTCWRCKTKIRFSHERLTLAVEHVQTCGGILILRPTGLSVEGSTREFKVKVRRRPKR
jgi:hypothetical protein